jgi:hypothetical protein
MSTPDPTPGPASPSPPPAPWILLDRTTVDQAAAALARLEQWLTSGDPTATADCARALSCGDDDPAGVTRWVTTLADRLTTRIEEADSWS